MIKSKRTETITFRASSQMRKEVEELAMKNDATISEVLRYALNNIKSE